MDMAIAARSASSLSLTTPKNHHYSVRVTGDSPWITPTHPVLLCEGRRSWISCTCRKSNGSPTDADADANMPLNNAKNKHNNDRNSQNNAKNRHNNMKNRHGNGNAEGSSLTSNSHSWRCLSLQDVAKLGVPVWDTMNKAQKSLQEYLNNYLNPRPEEGAPSNPDLEWTWEDWIEYFGEVEERDSFASALKFQLDDAVENEDFKEAARLKGAIHAATADDLVAEVMAELKKALEEERYEEAAKVRDEAGTGLVGWWVGLSEGEDDPFGRIIHISPSQGRYIARAYTARQLISVAPGIPIFEIFLRKDGEAYRQQAVYLQRDAISVASPSSGDFNGNIAKNVGDEGRTAVTQMMVDDEKDEDNNSRDEGLNRILNFLKVIIPDVKLKSFRAISSNIEDNISKIIERLVEEPVVQKEGDIVNKRDTQEETGEEESGDNSSKVAVGGVVQSIADDRGARTTARVPARIEYKSCDSFVFHIDDVGMRQPILLKEMAPPLRINATSGQASFDILGSEAEETLPDVEKVTVKVSKELGDFLKLAVSQVQKRRGLYKCTQFQRLNVSEANADDVCGLYVGAFGPFTSELIQLRRKHGNWHDGDDVSTDSGKLDFYEYVEAVKLTGDFNVPAGQVTFKARIGKYNRLPHRGIYPEDIGVTARYKGQGRLAERGFKNPQWIDGELLILDGKGAGQLNGAKMGFIYSVLDRHYLVLFRHLKLQG